MIKWITNPQHYSTWMLMPPHTLSHSTRFSTPPTPFPKEYGFQDKAYTESVWSWSYQQESGLNFSLVHFPFIMSSTWYSQPCPNSEFKVDKCIILPFRMNIIITTIALNFTLLLIPETQRSPFGFLFFVFFLKIWLAYRCFGHPPPPPNQHTRTHFPIPKEVRLSKHIDDFKAL